MIGSETHSNDFSNSAVIKHYIVTLKIFLARLANVCRVYHTFGLPQNLDGHSCSLTGFGLWLFVRALQVWCWFERVTP